jgi:hypothetical protein
MDKRTPRESETREATSRKKSWAPPTVLPEPLLCKAPEETMAERDDYYRQHAQSQMTSVENNFMRENDPRMPLVRPEISTRVTFGKGRG